MNVLTSARPPRRAGRDQRSFLRQRAQPAMNGLIDGSLSPWRPSSRWRSPHQPHYAFLAGLATALGAGGPARLYRQASHLFDVTTGNNALFGSPEQTCGDDYLCTAKQGYDAPTGLGTPDGIGAF